MDLFTSSILDRAKKLFGELDGLPLAEKVETLNQIREALHAHSPFMSEPVDLVLWVPHEQVEENDYNPNHTATSEMKLLEVSIDRNGYTQPIVTHDGSVVDGAHRSRVGKTSKSVRSRTHGYLPITRIRAARGDRAARMYATIQHNRARGEHAVAGMADMVECLLLAGKSDKEILEELGMSSDELLRFKQRKGLPAIYKDREYSKAWE